MLVVWPSRNNPLNTYTPNADGGGGKDRSCNHELVGKARTKKKGPAKLLENERAIGGGREGAKERELRVGAEER